MIDIIDNHELFGSVLNPCPSGLARKPVSGARGAPQIDEALGIHEMIELGQLVEAEHAKHACYGV